MCHHHSRDRRRRDGDVGIISDVDAAGGYPGSRAYRCRRRDRARRAPPPSTPRPPRGSRHDEHDSPPFVDFDTTGCGPFPLPYDPGYTHVSPGVCDTCADSAEARRAWVELLLGQLPSHRANAERTATLGDNAPPTTEEVPSVGGRLRGVPRGGFQRRRAQGRGRHPAGHGGREGAALTQEGAWTTCSRA